MPSFSEAESSRFDRASAAKADKEQMARARAVSEIEESFITISKWLSVNWFTVFEPSVAINPESAACRAASKLTTDDTDFTDKNLFRR